LSFFRQPALHFLRAWSHTRMYAPGARKNCALSGEKNPALKNTLAGSLIALRLSPRQIAISRQRSCRRKLQFFRRPDEGDPEAYTSMRG